MSHVKVKLDFLQYLHERAQESRNRESQAILMFLAGTVFFIGGTLESISLTEEPEWFLFIPYHASNIPGALLGLTLILGGLSLMVFGMGAALKWRLIRRSYLEQLHEMSSGKWDDLKQSRETSFSQKPTLQEPSLQEPSLQEPRETETESTIEWWVYKDTAKPDRARIHRSTCSYCKPSKRRKFDKTKEEDTDWLGPYHTWKKAWKIAKGLRREDVTFCKKCCQKLNTLEEKGHLEFLLGSSQAVAQK